MKEERNRMKIEKASEEKKTLKRETVKKYHRREGLCPSLEGVAEMRRKIENVWCG